MVNAWTGDQTLQLYRIISEHGNTPANWLECLQIKRKQLELKSHAAFLELKALQEDSKINGAEFGCVCVKERWCVWANAEQRSSRVAWRTDSHRFCNLIDRSQLLGQCLLLPPYSIVWLTLSHALSFFFFFIFLLSKISIYNRYKPKCDDVD